MTPLSVAFVGADSGPWTIERMDAVTGEPLPPARRVTVLEGPASRRLPEEAVWALRGVTSNERYVTREEHDALEALQQGLGRPQATRAALIAIRKSQAWWDRSQDERRHLFEETSRHVAIGLEFLPAIARRLHHGRDLGEPFDFLAWFEFAPADAGAFDELAGRLRATDEWSHVEREVDIRLAR